MTAPYWVDIIEDIVDRVRADSSKPAALDTDEPFFMHGPRIEIVETLLEKDQHSTNKYNKYPLIALIQDFEESNNADMTVKSSVSLNIIIAMDTKPEYKAADRYTNTFKPVLYPLYNIFLERIIKSGWFSNVGGSLIAHDKYDRVNWGRYQSDQDIIVDHIDAIEIQNLELDLFNTSRTCNTT